VNGDGAHLVSPTRGCKVGGFGANNEGNGAVSMTVNPLKLLELVTKGVAAGSRNTVDSASLNKRLEQAAIAAKSAGQFATFSAQIGISASNLMFVRLNIGANALEILKGIPQARPILEVLTKVSSVKSGMGLQVTETDFGGRKNFENALQAIGMGPAVSTLYQMRQQRA
jgi:hypothetical protein